MKYTITVDLKRWLSLVRNYGYAIGVLEGIEHHKLTPELRKQIKEALMTLLEDWDDILLEEDNE